jgi:hypothetical protein
MNRGWILAAFLGSLVACNKPSADAPPAASAASSSTAALPAASAAPSPAAAADQPAANAQAEGVDPSVAPAVEDTSDITAATYKKELDTLDKEIAALK